MRDLRKLLLLSVTVLSAVAILSSPASAQTVEVLNETTGEHCSSFTMVNHQPVGATCTLRAVSSTPTALLQHTGITEVVFSQCNIEFETALDENGAGFLYNQVLTPEGGVCGREPCDEAGTGATAHRSLAWPGQVREDGPSTAGVATLRKTFCLYAHSTSGGEGSAGTPCLIDLTLVHVGEHDGEVTSAPGGMGNGAAPCLNLGGAVEVDGHWVSAPNAAHPDSIEIRHLDDE